MAVGERRQLHGDLYREIIAFDDRGDPVFLDLLPTLGDTAFDWAFFVVYHHPAADPIPWLRLACHAGRMTALTLRPCCCAWTGCSSTAKSAIPGRPGCGRSCP